MSSNTAQLMENTSVFSVSQSWTSPLRPLRFIWAIASIAGTIALIIHIYNLSLVYLQYPVSIKSKMVAKDVMLFPAVTICNMNSLKRSTLMKDCTTMRELATLDKPSDERSSCTPGADDHEDLGWDSGYEYSGSGYYMYEDPGGDYGYYGGTVDVESSDYPDYSGYGWNDTVSPEYDTDYNWDGGYGSGGSIDLDYGESADIGAGNVEMGFYDVQPKVVNSFATALKSGVKGRAFAGLLAQTKTDDYSDVKGVLALPPKVITKYGYTPEDLVLQCSFDRKPCNFTDFYEFYSATNGRCATFNTRLAHSTQEAPKIRATRFHGASHGLQVTVNIKRKEYVGFLSEEYGVRIIVHPANVVPDVNGGVVATVGTKTRIALHKNVLKRLPTPYESMCAAKMNQEYRNFTVIPEHATTTTQQCIDACVAKHIANCSHSLMTTGSYPIFHRNQTMPQFDFFNTTHLACRDKVDARMLLPKTNEKHLSCKCNPICYDEYYSKVVYSGNWPTEDWVKLMAFNKNESKSKWIQMAFLEDPYYWAPEEAIQTFAEKNLVRFQVYLEDLIETRLEEQPALSFSQIWADVGGTMGIYLGVTLMTFLEMLQFCLLLCCCRHKIGNKNDKA